MYRSPLMSLRFRTEPLDPSEPTGAGSVRAVLDELHAEAEWQRRHRRPATEPVPRGDGFDWLQTIRFAP